MRTNVYIDAFNLYYGSLKGTGYKWLDLGALCRKILPRNEIHRIRYFTARVSARPRDPTAPQRQQAYLRALETIPELTIHYGTFLSNKTWMPLAKPPKKGRPTVEVIKTEEKGSDVNLATHLLVDGFQDDFECAVLITNDSDLAEPVRVVRETLNKPVGVINPHQKRHASVELTAGATFVRKLRTSAVRACQFPSELTDEKGSIRPPPTW